MASRRGPKSLAAHLSEWNTFNSPLLRLPSELRQMIWTYAFGSMAIMPQKHTDTMEYFTSTAGPTAMDPCGPKIEKMIRAKSVASKDTSKNTHIALTSPVPLICKQIYTESFHVIYSSGTFCFLHPDHFQAFALLHKHARQVHKIWFCIGDDQWDWRLVSRFKNLNGVSIHFRDAGEGYDGSGAFMRRPGNITSFEPFRQHRLDADKTRVFMYPPGNPRAGESRLSARQIRAYILNYRPTGSTAEADRRAREQRATARLHKETRSSDIPRPGRMEEQEKNFDMTELERRLPVGHLWN